jgi:hypothetical protein
VRKMCNWRKGYDRDIKMLMTSMKTGQEHPYHSPTSSY